MPEALDDDLPPANTRRWVMSRKVQIVTAVRAGRLSLDEACSRYSLSEEEFRDWERLIDRHGAEALKTTRLQLYRRRSA